MAFRLLLSANMTWPSQHGREPHLSLFKLRLQLRDFRNDTYSLAEVLQDRVFNDLDAKTAQYRSNFLHPQLQDDDKLGGPSADAQRRSLERGLDGRASGT